SECPRGKDCSRRAFRSRAENRSRDPRSLSPFAGHRQSLAPYLRGFFAARSLAASSAAQGRGVHSRRGPLGWLAALRARSVPLRGAVNELPVSGKARDGEALFVVGGLAAAIRSCSRGNVVGR